MQIIEKREGVSTIPIDIKREIDPIRDVITLLRLYRTIKKLSPSIVNASTPKAGFLGMVASWLAGVPVRIYTLRGLRMETKIGFTRFVLNCTERVAAACAHKVICVSESLRRLFINLKLSPESKTLVLCHGSSNGIDIERFHSNIQPNEKILLREELSIPADARVIGYVGRLTNDKGILELLEVFRILRRIFHNLYLLVIGDFEQGDPVPAECLNEFKEHRQIVKKNFVSDPQAYYGLMDVLVFPSYREGFPNAPLEAAASAIPTVGFRVTGTVDAIVDGNTGRLVDFKDTAGLAEAIEYYLANETIRKQHGATAQERASQLFRPEKLWTALHKEYLALLNNDTIISNELKSTKKQEEEGVKR